MSHALPVTALTRWEVRRAIRLGVPSDFRIAAQGARASAGLATVHVRDGREARALALARLIAAAPKLVDVLRELTELAVLAYDVQTTDSGLIAPPQIKAARALLARLQGEVA
jgi:hypothetical protein